MATEKQPKQKKRFRKSKSYWYYTPKELETTQGQAKESEDFPPLEQHNTGSRKAGNRKEKTNKQSEVPTQVSGQPSDTVRELSLTNNNNNKTDSIAAEGGRNEAIGKANGLNSDTGYTEGAEEVSGKSKSSVSISIIDGDDGDSVMKNVARVHNQGNKDGNCNGKPDQKATGESTSPDTRKEARESGPGDNSSPTPEVQPPQQKGIINTDSNNNTAPHSPSKGEGSGEVARSVKQGQEVSPPKIGFPTANPSVLPETRFGGNSRSIGMPPPNFDSSFPGQVSERELGTTAGLGGCNDILTGGYSSTDADKARQKSNQGNEAIFEFLGQLSSQIKKLDSKLDVIDSTTSDLKGELSRVDSKVQDMSMQINTVKEELRQYDKKWESRINDINDRLMGAENNWQKAEKKWEDTRISIHKDMEIAQSSLDSNSSKIIGLEEKIQDLQSKWESVEKVERKILKAAENKFDDLKMAITDDVKGSLRQDIKHNHEQMKRENRYESLKGQASANKLFLVALGVPENTQEGDKSHISAIFKDRLGLVRLNIIETFRLGRGARPDSPRPMVIKFMRMGDRMMVWRKKRALASDNVEDPIIWIQEYVPKQLRMDTRVLQRIMKVARMNPAAYGEPYISEFQVNINGRGFGMGNIRELPRELHPEYVYTPRTEETVVFFTKFSPLSNHYRSPFSLEGTTYNCVEQYLAQQKALLADNQQLAERAMECNDPADHKVILNTLKQETQERWKEKAEEIIPKAIRAKFSQNPQLAAFLVETAPRRIGEASTDGVWGIGLKLEDKNVLGEASWRKEGNLLGKTLSLIRQEIITKNSDNSVRQEIVTKKPDNIKQKQ